MTILRNSKSTGTRIIHPILWLSAFCVEALLNGGINVRSWHFADQSDGALRGQQLTQLGHSAVGSAELNRMIDGRGSHSWEQNEGEGGNCRVHRGSVFGSHTRTYKKAAPVIGGSLAPEPQ
jgi:hypothetical protein